MKTILPTHTAELEIKIPPIDDIMKEVVNSLIMKVTNLDTFYRNSKLEDLSFYSPNLVDFSIQLASVAIYHDRHTFFSARSLAAVKEIFINSNVRFNCLMNFTYTFFAIAAKKGYSKANIINWFIDYYDDVSVIDETNTLLSVEAIDTLKVVDIENLIQANIWLVPLYLLGFDQVLIGQLTS